ncbi:hypothetical protein [Rhodococcus sp. NPDC049939]|uniref:hypothetical protein n=1 Tax=Rhodococcus sp. NPDC049939 TaxID=3155511 RepID=UPI0033FA7AEA
MNDLTVDAASIADFAAALSGIGVTARTNSAAYEHTEIANTVALAAANAVGNGG